MAEQDPQWRQAFTLLWADALRASDAVDDVIAKASTIPVLDIGLPDLDGDAPGRGIKTDSASVHATLIAVTGYGQKQYAIDSTAAGFDHRLVKPVNASILIQLLAGL